MQESTCNVLKKIVNKTNFNKWNLKYVSSRKKKLQRLLIWKQEITSGKSYLRSDNFPSLAFGERNSCLENWQIPLESDHGVAPTMKKDFAMITRYQNRSTQSYQSKWKRCRDAPSFDFKWYHMLLTQWKLCHKGTKHGTFNNSLTVSLSTFWSRRCMSKKQTKIKLEYLF